MAEKVKAVALTTVDNPWSFFDDYDNWWQFDVTNQYNCESITDRVANVTDDMSTIEVRAAIEEGIVNFVKADPLGIYTIEEKWIDYKPIAD